MTKLPSYLSAGLLVCLCLCSGTAMGQAAGGNTPTQADDYHSLYRRLEEAERKIRELQEYQVHRLPATGTSAMPVTTNGSFFNAAGLADRVTELENFSKSQQETIDELQSDADGFAKSGTSGSTMKVSGRVHMDFWGFPEDSPGVNAFETGAVGVSPMDRFIFRRMRFGVSGDIADNMLYKIEMEFAGGNLSEYRDAYFGFKDLPFLRTLLIGNQKRPYGLDHLNSSRYNVFIERPFIIEAFNQDARRLGIASYGLSEDEAYNWRFGVYNSVIGQANPGHVGDQYELEFAARFANTIWYDECSDGRGYAHWAVSGTLAHPDGLNGGSDGSRFRTRPEARTTNRWLNTGNIAGADTYQLLGFEGVLNIGAFQAVGEYQHVWYQRDAGFGPDMEFHGGYVYVAYFLTGEHVPWTRKSGTLGRVKPFENFFWVNTSDGYMDRGWGAWQVAIRYSQGDLSDDNIFGGVGESVTFGLNWHWTPNARVQFNYIYGTVNSHAVVAGQTGGHYAIIGVRGMVDF